MTTFMAIAILVCVVLAIATLALCWPTKTREERAHKKAVTFTARYGKSPLEDYMLDAAKYTMASPTQLKSERDKQREKYVGTRYEPHKTFTNVASGTPVAPDTSSDSTTGALVGGMISGNLEGALIGGAIGGVVGGVIGGEIAKSEEPSTSFDPPTVETPSVESPSTDTTSFETPSISTDDSVSGGGFGGGGGDTF